MLLFSPCSASFPSAENDFQKEVFDFCNAWKAGKEEFIFSTSGSTGKPKSISIHREKMIYSANLTSNWLNLKKNDIALLCLPIQYIAGAMVLVRALVLDLKVAIIEPKQNPIEELVNAGINVDVASFVPTQWAQMIQFPAELDHIFKASKGVLLGGAGLDSQLEKKTSAFAFPVFHTYAMTETVSHIAYRRINIHSQPSIYEVFPGILIDKNENSCLKIQSFLTDHQWLETNDLVEIISEKSFQLLGRADFVINSGGFKIQPIKVETLCQDFFSDKNLSCDLFLFGIEDAFYGQKAVLFVNQELAQVYFTELKNYLANHLDSKEIPKECIFVPNFQINSNGKIDRIKTVNLYFNNQK